MVDFAGTDLLRFLLAVCEQFVQLCAQDSRLGRAMRQQFNAVYSPNPQDVFNPKPVGTQVNPCLRREHPASYPDFARIGETLRNPNFADLFGEKEKGAPANPHAQK
jgi:hypothetical protein